MLWLGLDIPLLVTPTLTLSQTKRSSDHQGNIPHIDVYLVFEPIEVAMPEIDPLVQDEVYMRMAAVVDLYMRIMDELLTRDHDIRAK